MMIQQQSIVYKLHRVIRSDLYSVIYIPSVQEEKLIRIKDNRLRPAYTTLIELCVTTRSPIHTIDAM